jgi:hypothetical protein
LDSARVDYLGAKSFTASGGEHFVERNSMKNRTNGAALRAAKTTSRNKPARMTFLDRVLLADDLEHRAVLKAANERRRKAGKAITVNVSADVYGFLCAAGVIHGGTPEECAAEWMEQNMNEWANSDFLLED